MSDEKIKKRKRIDLIRDILCVLSVISILATVIIMPYLSEAEVFCNSIGDNIGNTAEQRAIYCRDSVYSDLCTIGSVYLSNCRDGEYTGTGMLYESMLSTLSWFDNNNGKGNIFGISASVGQRGLTIEQTKYNITNIDSAYYYFFVCYGNEYLTNIPWLDDIDERQVGITADRLSNDYPDDFYLRRNNTIISKTKYDESAFGKKEVYYSVVDDSGNVISTSEYISSDKLLLGSALHDDIGNYTFCFDSTGDKMINSYPKEVDNNDYPSCYLNDDGSLTVYYYDSDTFAEREETYEYGSEQYKAVLNLTNGVAYKNSWLNIDELPRFTNQMVDVSQLQVFMTPKFDIVESSGKLIKRYNNIYNTLNITIIALVIAIFVFTSVFILLSVVRPASAYIGDSKTIRGKLFKFDLSLILLPLSVYAVLTITNRSEIFAFDINNLATAKKPAVLWTSLLFSSITVYYSFDGLIRAVKLLIAKEPQTLLLRNIWDSTEKLREIYGKIPFVAWHRSLSLKTRYAILHTALIISVIIYISRMIYTRIVLYYYDYTNFMLIIIALICLRYLFLTITTVRDVNRLEKQINKILGSEEDNKLKDINIHSPIRPMSDKLMQIAELTEEAVEQQVRSEKMKIELVTNVSHDLKTPLTSIVSYIDLLQKLDLPDEARDYVSILSRKSDKLRDIVQDVFSLAKAVSGIEVNLEKIDFAMMVRQILADYDDKIAESGRDVRASVEPASALITSDGVKMYRVIQNLIDNALKYSMPNTRIYIMLNESEDKYRLSVKNVAAEEMHFTAEEITERFVRGDKSRTDGGSGLGLAIAKSFTEACGGIFSVEIDGDIFNASVSFAKYTEESAVDDAGVSGLLTD